MTSGENKISRVARELVDFTIINYLKLVKKKQKLVRDVVYLLFLVRFTLPHYQLTYTHPLLSLLDDSFQQ